MFFTYSSLFHICKSDICSNLCQLVNVSFLGRLAKTFGSTSEATCQAERMLFYKFYFVFLIPLLRSRNQFTTMLQKPGLTKIVGCDMNMRMNWYCRHASFEQPNWEPFRVNVRGDRVRAALRPSALSSQRKPPVFHCIQVMRNGHVPRNGNSGKPCSAGRIMVTCNDSKMTTSTGDITVFS